MKLLIGLLCCSLAACAIDDDLETGVEIDEATVTTGPAYLYPNGAGLYRVGGLTGGVLCDDGSYLPSCLADSIDFSLMPQLTSAQRKELLDRFSAADAHLENVSVIVTGQWRTVKVRDHRYPGGGYRRIDFQLVSAYESPTVAPHVADFFYLTGTTVQQAKKVTSGKVLPFNAIIDFPGPVIANSSGVVNDAYITGTVIQPPVFPSTPAEIDADAYFRRL